MALMSLCNLLLFIFQVFGDFNGDMYEIEGPCQNGMCPSSFLQVQSVKKRSDYETVFEEEEGENERMRRKRRRRQPAEPSETIVTVPATLTAKALLAEFRVCSNHPTMVRMGQRGDGGYVIPKQIPFSAATMISIGIRDFDPVSHAITNQYGITAYLYDCFSGPSPCPPELGRCNVIFEQTCAGDKAESKDGRQFQPIQQMVNTHGGTQDLLLKIDCEGCEWDALDVLPEETLQRFQLVFGEVHWLEKAENHEKYLRVMNKLTKYFNLVHTHGCNCFGQVHLEGSEFKIPKIVEVTFVRKDLGGYMLPDMDSEYISTLDVPICPGNREFEVQDFVLP